MTYWTSIIVQEALEIAGECCGAAYWTCGNGREEDGSKSSSRLDESSLDSASNVTENQEHGGGTCRHDSTDGVDDGLRRGADGRPDRPQRGQVQYNHLCDRQGTKSGQNLGTDEEKDEALIIRLPEAVLFRRRCWGLKETNYGVELQVGVEMEDGRVEEVFVGKYLYPRWRVGCPKVGFLTRRLSDDPGTTQRC